MQHHTHGPTPERARRVPARSPLILRAIAIAPRAPPIKTRAARAQSSSAGVAVAVSGRGSSGSREGALPRERHLAARARRAAERHGGVDRRERPLAEVERAVGRDARRGPSRRRTAGPPCAARRLSRRAPVRERERRCRSCRAVQPGPGATYGPGGRSMAIVEPSLPLRSVSCAPFVTGSMIASPASPNVPRRGGTRCRAGCRSRG